MTSAETGSTPVLSMVTARLAQLHQQSRVAAGSLIVTVFGDAVLPRGGGLWLGSLIALMEQFGLNERLVRTSVFRLVKEEWLQTETEGRRANYRLTATGRSRFEEASRHIYAARAPLWDRQWRMLMVAGTIGTQSREALRKAMRWQGFGELSPTSFVHPGADLLQCLEAIRAEGLGALLPQLMPLLAAKVCVPAAKETIQPNERALVQSAWNLDLLSRDYTLFLDTYRPLYDQLNALEAAGTSAEAAGLSAFQARTLMIHDFRRILLRDPELPSDLLPEGWPGQTARTLCADIYRRLMPASESFLGRGMLLADGSPTAATPLLLERFNPV